MSSPMSNHTIMLPTKRNMRSCVDKDISYDHAMTKKEHEIMSSPKRNMRSCNPQRVITQLCHRQRGHDMRSCYRQIYLTRSCNRHRGM